MQEIKQRMTISRNHSETNLLNEITSYGNVKKELLQQEHETNKGAGYIIDII